VASDSMGIALTCMLANQPITANRASRMMVFLKVDILVAKCIKSMLMIKKSVERLVTMLNQRECVLSNADRSRDC
jgi:hypothetical protein